MGRRSLRYTPAGLCFAKAGPSLLLRPAKARAASRATKRVIMVTCEASGWHSFAGAGAGGGRLGRSRISSRACAHLRSRRGERRAGHGEPTKEEREAWRRRQRPAWRPPQSPRKRDASFRDLGDRWRTLGELGDRGDPDEAPFPPAPRWAGPAQCPALRRPAGRARAAHRLTSGPSPSNWRPAPAPAPPAGQLTIYEPENLCKCSARVLARGFGFKSRLTGSPPPRRRLARNG